MVISASEQAFVSGCDWMRSEIERKLKGNSENKSTELDNTDVSDSFFKTEFQEGYTDGDSTTYFNTNQSKNKT